MARETMNKINNLGTLAAIHDEGNGDPDASLVSQKNSN
jgi:hypothetical protein